MAMKVKVRGGKVVFRTQERIMRTDWLSTSFSRPGWAKKYGDAKAAKMRVVDLECNHQTITMNFDKAHCPCCQELIDRGLDYQGFRELGLPDPLKEERDERNRALRDARDEARSKQPHADGGERT